MDDKDRAAKYQSMLDETDNVDVARIAIKMLRLSNDPVAREFIFLFEALEGQLMARLRPRRNPDRIKRPDTRPPATLAIGDRVKHRDFDKRKGEYITRLGTIKKVFLGGKRSGIPFPTYVVTWDEPNRRFDFPSYAGSSLTLIGDK